MWNSLHVSTLPPLSLRIGQCSQDNNVSLAKKLFEEALKELGVSKEELPEIEDILMDEMPIIPLCFINKRFAKNPNLTGKNLSPLQFIDFKTAYFKKKNIEPL